MRRFAIGTVLLFAAAIAGADTVKMKDGETVTGRIASTNEDQVEVVTSTGTRTLYKKDIADLTYEPKPEAADRKTPKSPYYPTVSFRPLRAFASIDAFTAADGDDRFKSNFDASLDALGTLGNTTGSMTSEGGLGGRIGVLFCRPSGLEVGPSVGFLKGPSAEGESDTDLSPAGVLHEEAEIETEFTRLLLEARRAFRVSKRFSLRLGAGVGYARGKIEETDTQSGTANTSAHASDSWSGLTWEISPAVVFDWNPISLELGVRYAQFPEKGETDDFDNFEWNPFGIFLGILY